MIRRALIGGVLLSLSGGATASALPCTAVLCLTEGLTTGTCGPPVAYFKSIIIPAPWGVNWPATEVARTQWLRICPDVDSGLTGALGAGGARRCDFNSLVHDLNNAKVSVSVGEGDKALRDGVAASIPRWCQRLSDVVNRLYADARARTVELGLNVKPAAATIYRLPVRGRWCRRYQFDRDEYRSYCVARWHDPQTPPGDAAIRGWLDAAAPRSGPVVETEGR